MTNAVLDLLSTVTVVAVVGTAATLLLLIDLVRRELGGRRIVFLRYRGIGAAMTLTFLSLAILRFVRLGA